MNIVGAVCVLMHYVHGLNKQETHKQYQSSVSNFTKLQSQCLKDIAHQKKRLKQLREGSARYVCGSVPCLPYVSLTKQRDTVSDCRLSTTDADDLELKEKIDTLIGKRTQQIAALEDSLPRDSDLYLRIILDGINVSFLDQEQRKRHCP